MALDEAHEVTAAALGAQPREIVFTAGGTEAANLAIKGAAWAGKGEGHRILTSAVEHDATLNALQHLEKFGFEVIVLPVDLYGRLDPETLDAALDERTILVALQVANNERYGPPLRDSIATVRRIRGRRTLSTSMASRVPRTSTDVQALDADLGRHRGPQARRTRMGAPIRSGTAVMAQTHRRRSGAY
jgi:selenocysteine lyase/cysteine desulfurase